MTRRFQFSLKTLLCVMAVVAAFFGGMRLERELERRRHYTSDLGIPFPQGSFAKFVSNGDPTPTCGGSKSGTQE